MNEWIMRQRQEFESLSEDEKNKKIEKEKEEALRINDKIDLFVSPGEIVSGMNERGIVTGISRVDVIFKNKQKAKDKKDLDVPGRDYSTCYASILSGALYFDANEFNGDMIGKLRGLFKGVPIVDLGAGKNNSGYSLASLFEASGYIGVDPYNWEGLTDEIVDSSMGPAIADLYKRKFPELSTDVNNIPYSVVAEDALSFLKRLPDHSVGIFSFGTDDLVMFGAEDDPVKIEEIKRYIANVVNEIKRVMHPASAMLSADSVFGGPKEFNDFECEYQVQAGHEGKQSFYVVKPKI